MSLFLHWDSLNKMESASNFQTSLRCHYVIDTHNVLEDNSPGKMISQAPTSCKQIRKLRLCQVKTHVKTARNFHYMNVDFCDFKQLCATNSMQYLINISNLLLDRCLENIFLSFLQIYHLVVRMLSLISTMDTERMECRFLTLMGQMNRWNRFLHTAIWRASVMQELLLYLMEGSYIV